MIRFLCLLVLAVAFVWCGATVKLGHRTFFGHVKAVWSTEEAQDMKKGVEQSAKPMLQKVKRGVEAGYREATRDDAPGVTRPAERPAEAEQAPDAGTPAPSTVDKPARKHRRKHAEH